MGRSIRKNGWFTNTGLYIFSLVKPHKHLRGRGDFFENCRRIYATGEKFELVYNRKWLTKEIFWVNVKERVTDLLKSKAKISKLRECLIEENNNLSLFKRVADWVTEGKKI